VDTGIGVNENAFRSEALGAVTGDGVAMIEMTLLARLELALAVVVETCNEPTVGIDRLDEREVAVSDAELFDGRGELDESASGMSLPPGSGVSPSVTSARVARRGGMPRAPTMSSR
jgi:hypothetical protein